MGAASAPLVCGMEAALGRRQNKTSVFNGTGAQKTFPMRSTRRVIKRGGHGQYGRTGLCQGAIQRGKAQIIADAHPDPAERRVRHHRPCPRPIAGRFTILLGCRDIDVEHVDLVIAGTNAAVWRDQKGPVGKTAIGIVGQQPKRTDQQPDLQSGGLGLQCGQGQIVVLVAQDRSLAGAVR